MHRLAYAAYGLMISSAGVTFVFLEDIETDYGLPSWGIGLISALAFITILLTTLAFSPLGDRGFLHPLGVSGLVICIIGNAWIGLATELWSIATSRALVGIGTGLFAVAMRKALIGDDIGDSGQRIGTMVSVAVAGFIAGPGIGAWLAEIGGIEFPYLLIAGLLTALALPVTRWLGTVEIAVSDHVKLRAMLPLLRSRNVRIAAACNVALFFNIGVFDSTVDKYLTSLGVSNVSVGWILVMIGTPLILLPSRAGRFIDGFADPRRLVLLMTVMMVPAIATLGLWVAVVPFVVFALIETSLESVLFPALARTVADESGAEQSAIGQGILEVFGQSAASVGALVAPLAYSWQDGPRGSFGMSAVVGLLCVTYALTAYVSAGSKRSIQAVHS